MLYYDAKARYISGDYNGVISLISSKINMLLKQPEESILFSPIMTLLDSYIILNKNKEAKKLLSQLKSTYPDHFDSIIEYYQQHKPELYQQIAKILKLPKVIQIPVIDERLVRDETK